MGGLGSGSYCRWSSRDTTRDYRSIDVRRWKRDGLLEPGRSFRWNWLRNDEVFASIQVQTESDRVILDYRHRNRDEEEWKSEKYPVYLEWTDCHLGGHRPWFICPTHGCGRRVALLYGGGIFACRHCYQLAYESQRETDYDRAARRADKIRNRLDWEQGILNPKGWRKPKGMHWKTFERLNREHDFYQRTAMVGINSMFDRLKTI